VTENFKGDRLGPMSRGIEDVGSDELLKHPGRSRPGEINPQTAVDERYHALPPSLRPFTARFSVHLPTFLKAVQLCAPFAGDKVLGQRLATAEHQGIDDHLADGWTFLFLTRE
jgi:hypothetical protein